VLLGRERERQALDRVLATARSGQSAVLALVGEPGIGKTSLLRYAEEQAGGLRLLRVRGIESEANVPFAALLELLRPALGSLDRIPAPQAEALGVALALRPGEGGDRFAVGAGTLSLIAAQAEEAALLLIVDDAHLLDAPSAEALRFAFRRLLAEPVATVLAVREGEPSLLDGADLPAIRLSGLGVEESAELLGAVPRELAERLHGATAGNPLALLELGAAGSPPEVPPGEAPVHVPAAIARAFARRAAGLDEPAQKLLVLLAASESAELGVLERAAALLGIGLEGLEPATEAGLVRTGDGRAQFRHPLARAAVYAQAPAELRRQAHEALAGALPDRDADRRAWHLALAASGTDGAAASALEQAARRARDRSAYAVASTAFERSARLIPAEERRGPLLFAAAECAWSAGLPEQARALLDEAGARATAAGEAVAIEHLRGRIAVRSGPVMDGHEILVAAAEQSRERDPELAAEMLAEAVDACFFAGDAGAMARTSAHLAELVGAGASEKARLLAATSRGMSLVLAGEGERGIATMREAVELAARHPELREEIDLLPWLVMGPLFLREAGGVEATLDAAVEAARERAALGVLPWLLDRVARAHAGSEEWDLAALQYDEAIRLARETGQRVELAAALAGLAWLEARRGREEGCREHAHEALALCEELGVGLYETWALRALGELELRLGDAAAAVASLERLEARLAELGIADVDVWPSAELTDAYARLGRDEDAASLAARLARAAGEKGQPWSLARAERCAGLLAAEAYEPHFEAAIALHGQTPDRFETAITRLAYGARLRRDRRRRSAREELRAALEIFEGLSAEPLAASARAELAASGETARRRDPSTLDDLTPQELGIARQLAGGRTTRETAAALFLSPKTIEYHLRSIYRKLGVKSRDELARALASGPEP
jgi:DNA-binding CsgD family transcriptional regulator